MSIAGPKTLCVMKHGGSPWDTVLSLGCFELHSALWAVVIGCPWIRARASEPVPCWCEVMGWGMRCCPSCADICSWSEPAPQPEERNQNIWGTAELLCSTHLLHGEMSCSLNPIDCIDEMSTECRGSQGELLSWTFRLWVSAHNSTLGATAHPSALLPWQWRRHWFLCKVAVGLTQGLYGPLKSCKFQSSLILLCLDTGTGGMG